MRTPTFRADKYEKKNDGNALFIQTQRYAGVQKRKFKMAINDQVDIELKVKSTLNSPAVRALAVPGLFLSGTYYITYAKIIASLQRKHTGQTLINEICLLHDIWAGRNLSEDILDILERMMIPNFAGCAAPVPPCTPFTFDGSLLDGPDCLT